MNEVPPPPLYRGEVLPTLEWPRRSRNLEVSCAPTAAYRHNEVGLCNPLPIARRAAGQTEWLANRLRPSTTLTLDDLRGRPGMRMNPAARGSTATRRRVVERAILGLVLDSLRQSAIDWSQAKPEADRSEARGGLADSALRRRQE